MGASPLAAKKHPDQLDSGPLHKVAEKEAFYRKAPQSPLIAL
jgi:hypothetical protein